MTKQEMKAYIQLQRDIRDTKKRLLNNNTRRALAAKRASYERYLMMKIEEALRS